MAFRVGLESGEVVEVEGNSAFIGSDASCTIAMPEEDHLQSQHAMIKRVAGRWIIESQGDHLLSVGDAAPARVHWLQPGDSIKLSDQGPLLIFEPAADSSTTASPQPAVEQSAPKPQEAVVTAGEYAITKPAETAPPPSPPPAEDSHPEKPTSVHPAAWVAGGGVAVLVIAIATVGILWVGGAFRNQTETIETTPETTAGAPNEERSIDEKPETTAAPEKTFDVDRSLYAILLRTSEGQTFHLGTAFAVSNKHLASTASVIRAMQKLTAENSSMKAFAVSPMTQQELDLSGAKKTLHPEFSQTIRKLVAVEEKMSQLQQQLEQAADAQAAKPIEDQLTEQAEERYQILEHRFFYDVGVIETSATAEESADHLQITPATGNPAIGTTILLAGIPVQQNKEMVDPAAPPGPMQSKGQVFALVPSPTNPQADRLIVKCERDISGSYFPGSPVLNAADEVVGIYSRPTPPPFGADPEAATVTTHDLMSIDRLREMSLNLP